MSVEHGSRNTSIDLSRYKEQREQEIVYVLSLGDGEVRHIGGQSAHFLTVLSGRPQQVSVHEIAPKLDIAQGTVSADLVPQLQRALMGTEYMVGAPRHKGYSLLEKEQTVAAAERDALVPYAFVNGTHILLDPQSHALVTVLSPDVRQNRETLSVRLGVPPARLSRDVRYLNEVMTPACGIEVEVKNTRSERGYLLKGNVDLLPKNPR